MTIIEPHVHMLARTTDEYQTMYAAGIRCCVEPAFWLGTLRRYAGAMFDYFNLILDYETLRAERFGLDHYCCIAVNPKEADNAELAKETIDGMGPARSASTRSRRTKKPPSSGNYTLRRSGACP